MVGPLVVHPHRANAPVILRDAVLRQHRQPVSAPAQQQYSRRRNQDIPKLFLNGGPDNSTLTTSVFIYNQAFSGSYLYNRAAAASMLMFIVIAVCSAILFYIMRDKDEAKAEKEKKEALKAWKRSQKAAASR